MKKYISSLERRDIVLFALSTGIASTMLEKDEECKTMSAEEKKRIKYVLEHMKKYLVALFKRVGIEEQNRIVRYFQDSEVDLKIKSAVRSGNKYMQFQREDILNLCEELVSIKCFECKDKDYQKCKMYNLMQDLEVWLVNPNKKLCPYSYINDDTLDSQEKGEKTNDKKFKGKSKD